MSKGQFLLFIIQLGLLLTVARAMGIIARKLNQPPVIGELLAGIILGPSILGYFFPQIFSAIFPQNKELLLLLETISWLGMIFLMLLTGLEMDIRTIKRLGKPAFFSSLFGMVIPFALGFSLGWLVPDYLVGNSAERMIFSLFIATAMAISAVPVIARILMDLKLLNQNLGVVIISAAIVDDTTGWFILSVIAGLASKGELKLSSIGFSIGSVVLFILGSYFILLPLVKRLVKWFDNKAWIEEGAITIIFVVTLLCSALTEAIGIHAVFGAFVAGVMLAQCPETRAKYRGRIESILLAVFAPLFFAYSGLKVDLIRLVNPTILLIFLCLACFGKILGSTLGGRIGGLTRWEALSVGFGMNARGAMELVVAMVGLSLGILNEISYSIIVLIALFTTLMTPPLLKWSARRSKIFQEEKDKYVLGARQFNGDV
jgi:Kef-type K+ transport system membrane component KefB